MHSASFTNSTKLICVFPHLQGLWVLDWSLHRKQQQKTFTGIYHA